MPGLHLIFSPNDLGNLRRHLAPLSVVHHDQSYSSETLWSEPTLELHATRYTEYPVTRVSHRQFDIVLEGRIHNPGVATLETALGELAEALLGRNEPDRKQVVDWLRARDGEFVIAARDTTSGGWALVTDLLGRLPLYLMKRRDDECVVTRELSLFVHPGAGVAPDRMGIAQQLLLGFPSGKRTLLADIERVPPGSLIWWSPTTAKVSVETLHTFRFDECDSDATLTKCVEELVALFTTACRQTAEGTGRPAILSLSGGMDSRTVAAGLARAKVPFSAYTFVDPFGAAERDRVRATELARVLRLPWEAVPLMPATGADVAQLLTAKPGQISPAQAIDRQFLRQLLARHGRGLLFFSGDGGDAVLPCLRPDRRLISAREVVRVIIERYAQAPIELVVALTGVPESEIIEQLEATILAYPETEFADRFVHYMIYEREIKWSFEGEDRNRGFFFTAAPFLALSFFRAAMAVPAELKRGHALYREFLVHLSPAAANVPDAAKGVPITSPQFARQLRIGSWLARWPQAARLIRKLRSPGRRYGASAVLVRCLRAQLLGSDARAGLFDERAIQNLLAAPERQSTEFLENLLAISCVLERLNGKSDVLAEFRDAEFR